MNENGVYCTTYGANNNYNSQVEELYRIWTGRRLGDHITINDHLVVAKTTDGQLVGAAQLIIIPDNVFNRTWGLVENVFVHPDYRRKGVGRELMGAVETQAFLLGCKFIKLTSRKPEGQALYRNLGYAEGCSFYKNLGNTGEKKTEERV